MPRVDLLAAIPLFESLPPEDLDALASKLEERPFEAGEVVFSQGEPGSTLYVIVEGAVEIAYGEGKARVVLAELYADHYFGELSLLDGAPRSATATSKKGGRFYTLERDDFVDFVKTKPSASLYIMAEMVERMRRTNELMSRQVSKNVVEEAEEKLTVGQRVADKVAAFGGSWGFIGLFGGAMAMWMAVNAFHKVSWDVYPYILLNLCLSTIAALQAPVIMMSQNRQAAKDKLFAQNDFHVNLKNELGIEGVLKGQAEILARLQLLERQLGRRPLQELVPPQEVNNS